MFLCFSKLYKVIIFWKYFVFYRFLSVHLHILIKKMEQGNPPDKKRKLSSDKIDKITKRTTKKNKLKRKKSKKSPKQTETKSILQKVKNILDDNQRLTEQVLELRDSNKKLKKFGYIFENNNNFFFFI